MDFFEIAIPSIDDKKQLFINHMNELKSMSNQEYTLYKKWEEVKKYRDLISNAESVQSRIWKPSNIYDEKSTILEIENLHPVIEFVDRDDIKAMQDWLLLRVFIHTMEFEANPGRFLRFFVKDKNSGKYLGAISLGSDVVSITCRDNWIGWSRDNKFSDSRLNCSAIATTIVPVQPFGYNMLGGKLIASMLIMPEVRNIWSQLYSDTLVGITTTSLYGKHSMYQRIPFWKELGETAGRISLKPSYKVYDEWHSMIKDKYPEEYRKKTEGGGNGPATGLKQKIIQMIMREVGLVYTQYEHGFNRGVFYCSLYKNSTEYLKNTIPQEQLVSKWPINSEYDTIMNWWKPKAINRYKKMLDSGRINDEELFYTDIIDMSWEETKQHYLKKVGR